MALVSGPLFSLTASGQVGKAIVYSKWKGRDYVREYVIPANPRSLAQQFQRGILTALSRWWNPLQDDTGARESWNSSAAAKQISPFNAFISSNLQKETLDEAPEGWAIAGGGTAPTETTVSVTPSQVGTGGAKVVIAYTDAASTDLLICTMGQAGGAASTAQHFNRTMSGASGLVGDDSIEFDFSGIPAGSYYFAAKWIGSDGTTTAWVASAAPLTVA